MEYNIGTKVFRDWEIVAEIGEGGFGKVYRIRKEAFGLITEGALKVLQIPRSNADVKEALSQGMDEQSVTSYFKGIAEAFMREVAIMSDLRSHPNIVGCQDYDIVPHAGGIGWDILIRMELLTPLTEYLTTHTMDEQEVRRLGMDLCEALVFCQKRSLIHRDVKPGNIFVDDLGRFRLGDFGVARTAERTMGGMSKSGTENYMAPEVYLGREYGPTVDIYSVGLVLYQLMNGNRLPFYPLPPNPIEFSHRFEVMKKRMNGDPMPPPVHASEDFAAVILKACAFDSKDRYRTAGDLLEALQGKTQAAPMPDLQQGFAEPIPFAPRAGGFSYTPPTGDGTVGPAFAPPKAESASKADPFMPPQEPAQPKVEPPKTEEMFAMIAEDSFRTQFGIAVTGQVWQGTIRVGDAVTVKKLNDERFFAKVADILKNTESVGSAATDDDVVILLTGLQDTEVQAGDMLMGGIRPAKAQPKAEPEKAAPKAAPAQPVQKHSPVEIFHQVRNRHPLITPGKGLFHHASLRTLMLQVTAYEENDQDVLLAHDASMFSRGKTGFVVTKRGIYVKEPMAKAAFTSWQDFARGSFAVNPANDSEGLLNGAHCVYCSYGDKKLRQAVMDFFLDLHKTMKGKI